MFQALLEGNKNVIFSKIIIFVIFTLAINNTHAAENYKNLSLGQGYLFDKPLAIE